MKMNETENNLEFDDFPYICRICLFKGDTRPFTQDLKQIFTSIINIFIDDDDELPTNICTTCVVRLTDIKVFIDFAHVNNEHLKDVLLKHQQKASLGYFDQDTIFEITEEYSEFNNKDIINPVEQSTEDNDLTGDDSNEGDVEIKIEKDEVKKYFHCRICHNIFITFEDLTEHRKLNENCAFKSESCQKTFEPQKKLCAHRTENEKYRLEKYKCNICGKIFKRKAVLIMHKGAHTDETPYECKLCDKKFKFPQNLMRHDNIIHKGTKPYKCDICGEEFARLERIRQHKKSHSVICGHCGESVNRNDLRKHLEDHNLSSQQIKEHYDMQQQPYCFTCKVLFKNVPDYRQHLLEHKLQKGEINCSDSKCEICGKLLSSKSALQTHLTIHNGKKEFLCSICGQDFLKKHSLDLHLTKHTNQRSFECKQCGKKFKQASAYNIHRRIHTGEKLYKCDICSKSFRQSTHLKRHYLVHTGEKKFSCTYCGKHFAQKNNLKTHIRIHTGETPFWCTVCNKGFYDTSSLKKHEKGHLKI